MRDIKFRAWDGEQMIYTTDEFRSEQFLTTAGDILNRYDTVMQYTGLKDWHEGDILRSIHFVTAKGTKEYLIHIIKWSNEYTGWIAVSVDNEDDSLKTNGNCQLWVYLKDAPDAEKIGNIYENPELLK
jgi:uncharacterized phage protein (TIGR01671 family)